MLSADEQTLQGLVLYRRIPSGGEEIVRHRLRRIDDSTRALEFECRPGLYVIESAQLVSASVKISDCNASLTPPLFLKATLSARLLASAETARTASVNVLRCRTMEVLSYALRSSSGGNVIANVPADCLDVMVVAPSMAPVKVPRMALSLRQRLDMGTIALRPGGTLSLSVLSPQERPVGGATVMLCRAEDLGDFLAGVLSGASANALDVATSDPSGRVRFTGVQPGVVYVVAKAMELWGVAGAIEIVPGEETASEPVRLLPKAIVTLTVEGSVEWLPVGAKLWVLATPTLAGRWFPSAYVRADLDDSQSAQLPLPVAGRWRFELRSDTGGTNQVVETHTTEIKPGPENAVSFSARLTTFRGRIVGTGALALAGTVTLSQPDNPLMTHRATVTESGEFQVALPDTGDYRVEFSSRDGAVVGARATAHFQVDSETTVLLPTGTVSGRVLGADGKPITGAVVSAKASDLNDESAIRRGPLSRTTDASGRFTLLGLNPGPWEIGATFRDAAAEPRQLFVGDAATAIEVELTVADDSTVVGHVYDGRRQVLPSVRGWAYAEPNEAGQIVAISQFSTDLQGFFRARFDRPTRGAVQIIVVTPGRPVTGFRLPPQREKSVALVIPDAGGEVRLVLPRSDDSVSGLPAGWTLLALSNQEGATFPLVALSAMNAVTVVPSASSVTMLLPSLSAGRWRVARFPDLRASMLFTAGVEALPVVAEFNLPPSGRVTIDLRR